MATSGSIDFIVTRDDIIKEALEQMGVLAEGQSPSSDQLVSMSRTLNMMVKAWQAEGLSLFTVQKLYVFLEKNKNEYLLGSTTSDHVSNEYNRTTTSIAATASDSTITVVSDTGMDNGDYIGIKLSDNTMQWTTINGTPSSNVVTLTAVLTADVESGVTVFFYTSKATRPLKIVNATVVDSLANNSNVISVSSRQEYIALPQKDSDGRVTQLYYDPQITLGRLFVWPETDSVSTYLTLWVQRTLEDFDSASDNPDFPQEYYLALAFNLAALSCTKYGVPRDVRRDIMSVALGTKKTVESFDAEDGFQLSPSTH